MPGREFPGQVTRIANALQPGSRTLLTEIDLPNPDYVLSPGVYCTVELKIPRKTPSLIVPAEAIVFNRDGLNVAVVENGVAHIRHVTLVRDLGTAVEVSAGVNDSRRSRRVAFWSSDVHRYRHLPSSHCGGAERVRTHRPLFPRRRV